MQKILLVIDTYGDLVQLESMLKKLGFDTIGMQNSVSLQEQLLGFSPDVIVMNGKGNRVHGLELSQRIKKRKGLPKIILLFPKGYQPQATELASAQMDSVLEMPVDPIRFLMNLCKLTGMDSTALMDKFARLQGLDSGGEYGGVGPSSLSNHSDSIHVTGSKASANGAPRDRTNIYKQIAAQTTLPGKGGLAHDRIQAAIKDLRRSAVPEQDAELDESRREFVRALFRK